MEAELHDPCVVDIYETSLKISGEKHNLGHPQNFQETQCYSTGTALGLFRSLWSTSVDLNNFSIIFIAEKR